MKFKRAICAIDGLFAACKREQAAKRRRKTAANDRRTTSSEALTLTDAQRADASDKLATATLAVPALLSTEQAEALAEKARRLAEGAASNAHHNSSTSVDECNSGRANIINRVISCLETIQATRGLCSKDVDSDLRVLQRALDCEGERHPVACSSSSSSSSSNSSSSSYNTATSRRQLIAKLKAACADEHKSSAQATESNAAAPGFRRPHEKPSVTRSSTASIPAQAAVGRNDTESAMTRLMNGYSPAGARSSATAASAAASSRNELAMTAAAPGTSHQLLREAT